MPSSRMRSRELPRGAVRTFQFAGRGGELVARPSPPSDASIIMVANHGIWPPEDTPIDRMTDEQWHAHDGVNVDSVFGLIKHSVAQMKKQERQVESAKGDPPPPPIGHIVLVSSTAGQRGEAFHCDYAASKGALISMVKGLSTELARDGIRVNCVAPGWVATDMSAGALNDPPTRAKVFATIR